MPISPIIQPSKYDIRSIKICSNVLFKKWWFWLGFFIVFGIIGNFLPDSEKDIVKSNSKKVIERKNDFDVNKKIEVKYELQGYFPEKQKQKLVTFIKNNSEYTVSGSLSLKIKSKIDDRLIRRDVIFVKNLLPHKQTWAISWIKFSKSINISQEWSGVKYK